jgi:hypothetical protein
VLLSPTNPIRKGVKWALVAHTVAMFLFVTIPYGIGLNYPSIDYIDNRDFPGGDGLPPGPIGYSSGLNAEAAVIVLKVMFPLNQWLADGLLVGPISISVALAFDVGCCSSCIVVMSFIP